MAESPDISRSDISPEVRETIIRESLASWRDQGLISPEQYDALLARVATPAEPARPATPQRAVVQERKLGRGVTILINLGAIILAAGLIIFFASNWIEFGRAAKITSLFALVLFFYLVGFEQALGEGRVRFDNPTDFNTMLRLKEFILGGLLYRTSREKDLLILLNQENLQVYSGQKAAFNQKNSFRSSV